MRQLGEKLMKTYGIGLRHVSVYELREARPIDVMRAVAGSAICFVGRVVDGAGAIDTEAMTEALVRHSRLKIGMASPYQLRVIKTFPEAADRLPSRLKTWAAAQQARLARRGASGFRPRLLSIASPTFTDADAGGISPAGAASTGLQPRDAARK